MIPLVRLSDNGRDAAPPPRSLGDPRVAAAAGKRAVLVVEDELDALDATVEILEEEGFTVVGARNGKEALSLLNAGLRPALALVDLRMPVMDGWEFCSAVRADERFSEMAVAIVTASAAGHPLPDRKRDAGYFVKPVNCDRLLTVVRQFCG